MKMKTKKTISIFGIVLCFLIICAASIYAYFNMNETYFATTASILAMLIPSFLFWLNGKKEVRQNHLGVQLLIMAAIPVIRIGIVTYRWYVGLPSFSSVTTPEAAFIVVWTEAFAWFLTGAMFIVGSLYTDRIVEKIKSGKSENEI